MHNRSQSCVIDNFYLKCNSVLFHDLAVWDFDNCELQIVKHKNKKEDFYVGILSYSISMLVTKFVGVVAVNSTLLKQTLRTNNRALAKALEMKRQDLYNAQQTIIQQQEAQQHTLQQLSNLQRIAGLKDSAIETEVQLRIQVTDGTFVVHADL